MRLLIVAGETSGDHHAAALVRELMNLAHSNFSNTETDFEFFGLTGSEMREAGVETILRADELAITGLIEVGRALPKFRRVFQTLKRAAIERKPAAAILVDFPEFNLPLAKALHRLRVPVIYYISPQLWAWRAYRVRRMRRDVDLLLTILPFEKSWYAARGFHNVEFVGHPLAGEVKPRYGREEFCAKYKLDASHPLIALLPGSRHREIKLNLPPMLAAAAQISSQRDDAQFLVALTNTRPPADIETLIDDATAHAPSVQNSLHIIQGETREALAASDVAAIASGTATLEAALTNTPLVVVYKESFVNWHTLGRLIHVEHYGLVNLIAEQRIAPELMQHDFTGETLARELLQLLEPARNAEARAQLRNAVAKLGTGSALNRAAEVVRDFLNRENQ